MSEKAIELTAEVQSDQAPQTMAVARVESGAVGRALSLNEISERLRFIREVMAKEMRDEVDYGKIPGCGDKPSLLQPGAQKLLMTFNLREQVKKETLREHPNFHREYEITVVVFPAGQSPENGWDGVGTCSTLERKYRFRSANRRCPHCGKEQIIKGKEEFGGGWLCWKKKGGCGATFPDGDQAIEGQPAGDVEYDNPPDFWNTARKMAFKRALIHAAVNATNTSELWTQDLEDMADNKPPPRSAAPSGAQASTPKREKGADWESGASQGHPSANKGHTKSPQTVSKQDKSATDKTREWAIAELQKSHGAPIILEYLQQCGLLLPNEPLESWPLEYVPVSHPQLEMVRGQLNDFTTSGTAKKPGFVNPAPAATKPEKKAAAPAKPVEVPRDKDAGQQAELQEIDPSWEKMEGTVAQVSVKNGTKKNGEPWTLYGIKIGEDWYNTFSNTVGKAAQAAKADGGRVRLYYTEDDEGRFEAKAIV